MAGAHLRHTLNGCPTCKQYHCALAPAGLCACLRCYWHSSKFFLASSCSPTSRGRDLDPLPTAGALPASHAAGSRTPSLRDPRCIVRMHSVPLLARATAAYKAWILRVSCGFRLPNPPHCSHLSVDGRSASSCARAAPRPVVTDPAFAAQDSKENMTSIIMYPPLPL
jgi:hypothetical protein